MSAQGENGGESDGQAGGQNCDPNPPSPRTDEHSDSDLNSHNEVLDLKSLREKQKKLERTLRTQKHQQSTILKNQTEILTLLRKQKNQGTKRKSKEVLKSPKGKKRAAKGKSKAKLNRKPTTKKSSKRPRLRVASSTSEDTDSSDSSSSSSSSSTSSSSSATDSGKRSKAICVPIMKGSMPAGTTVPKKLKKEIQSHKYVEFSTLLNPNAATAYMLSMEQGPSSSVLKLKPQSSKRQLTENQWGIAYATYMSVYLEKYPEDLTDMLSYQQQIQRMMQRKANWRYYDFRFRSDREYSLYKWNMIRQDLERDAYANMDLNYSNRPATQSFHRGTFPAKGHCIA